MLIITIVYDDTTKDFIEDINNIKNFFNMKKVRLGISESIVKNTHFVKIYFNDNIYNNSLENNFYVYLSMALYDLVVDEFCNGELFNYLRDKYIFLKDSEVDALKERITFILKSEKLFLDKDDILYINIKNNIINNIIQCIKDIKVLNINGFLRFRSKAIKEELCSIVDSIVEKYINEKEYKEFIKLLRYFIEIQECKIDEVNIIVTEAGQYVIKNKRGDNILPQILTGLEDAKFSGTVSMEDIIISGLITNVPKRIVIHCSDNCKCKEFIDTIKDVFLERVAFCTGCAFCKAHKFHVKM